MKLFLLPFLFILFACSAGPSFAVEPVRTTSKKFKVCGKEFLLEVSKTTEARTKGLMFREKLDAKGGMIFVFRDSSPRSFWMKNVPITLDILFFDSAGKLVSSKSMPPSSSLVRDAFKPRYDSDGAAQFVVELAENSLKSFSTKELKSCKLSPVPSIDKTVE